MPHVTALHAGLLTGLFILLMYRTRLSGHGFALCGAPEVGVEPGGASVDRNVSTTLIRPMLVFRLGAWARRSRISPCWPRMRYMVRIERW